MRMSSRGRAHLANFVEKGPVPRRELAKVDVVDRIAIENEAIEFFLLKDFFQEVHVGVPAAEVEIGKNQGTFIHNDTPEFQGPFA